MILSQKFPYFISNHEVFSSKDKLEKIFPHIGLDNFKTSIKNSYGQIPFTINNSIFESQFVRLSTDSLWRRIVSRLLRAPACVLNTGINVLDFFLFRQSNRQLDVAFSSDNEVGAWDLATMAMRGIHSCQSWTAGRRSNLIGSIIDPCCGIIYLTDNEETQYGSNMLYRSIVRYVVHPKFGPCLFLERGYSQPIFDKFDHYCIDTLFACMLYRRTGLNVITQSGLADTPAKRELFIPSTAIVNKHMSCASYRDSALEYQSLGSKILKRFPSLSTFKNIFL